MATESEFSTASRPIKWASSFVIFYCNFAVGIILSLVGPTQKSFSLQFGTTVEHVSKVFTVNLGCYLAGALSAGFLFKVIKRQIGAIAALTAVSIAITVIPHVDSINAFFIAGGVFGYGIGIFDPAQIAWIIDIWRDDAGPFILSQHFAYALGTVVAPLLLEPFLLDHVTELEIALNSEGDNQRSPQNGNSVVPQLEPNTSALHIPFGLVGAIMAVGVFAQLVLLVVLRNQKAAEPPEICTATASVKPQHKYETSKRRKIIIIALCCTFIGFYQAMEMCTMQFLSNFAQSSPVGLSEKEAALVLSGMTFGFAAARAVGIIVVLKAAPQYILAGNIALIIAGNTILFTLGGSSVEWLWAGSICLGVGFSTTYPAFYAYVEKYIFVSDSVASIITVCGGLMAAIYPLIVGGWIEGHPSVLNYANYVSICMNIGAFSFLYWFTSGRNKVLEGDEKPGENVEKNL